MARVRLKGLNRVSKWLADGTNVTYYYAWKVGQRLPGKPGDREFVLGYSEAVESQKDDDTGALVEVSPLTKTPQVSKF